MGGHPYWYFTKYNIDISVTLDGLRRQEFSAGRYNPVMPDISFPITAASPSPGAQHSSMEEALEASEEDGTRSILDMLQISNVPYSEALAASEQDGMDLLCTTFPLSTDELNQLFGTDQPTHAMVQAKLVSEEHSEENDYQFWEHIDRGTGRHIIIYENGIPAEIFFSGYSFD
jgi:hypothetical protein